MREKEKLEGKKIQETDQDRDMQTEATQDKSKQQKCRCTRRKVSMTEATMRMKLLPDSARGSPQAFRLKTLWMRHHRLSQ
jgi:hypothetical protein